MDDDRILEDEMAPAGGSAGPARGRTLLELALLLGAGTLVVLAACAAAGVRGGSGGGEAKAVLQSEPDPVPARQLEPPSRQGVLPPGDLPSSPVRRFSATVPWEYGRAPLFATSNNRAEERERSLALRTTRRAYEGAPPVIPHSSTYGKGSKTCVDCHGPGMAMGRKTARPMSHPAFPDCLQCHVESENRELPPPAEPVVNGFEGLPRWGPGPVAYEGAPPAVPHPLLMRTRCLSCHGEHGYEGLRTPHSWRAGCTQCHVPTARGDREFPIARD